MLDLALAGLGCCRGRVVAGGPGGRLLGDTPGQGLVLVLLAGLALYLLHAAFVELPRALKAA